MRVEPSTSKQVDLGNSDSDLSLSEGKTKDRMSPDVEFNTEARTLDDILSDGEDMEEDHSDDNFLGDLKIFYDESEETGPNIDPEIAKIVNKGLRSVGQAEAVKKLKDKHKRPENIPNFTVHRVALIIWKNLSKKSQDLDWAVQKTMNKFMCGLMPILKQIDLIRKNKTELKQNPIIKELKQLAADSVLMITHAVAASNQVRKDAIKTKLDSKFHSICESSHTVSEKQLFEDNLNTTLKELDDTKKFHLNKYSFNRRDFLKSSENPQTTPFRVFTGVGAKTTGQHMERNIRTIRTMATRRAQAKQIKTVNKCKYTIREQCSVQILSTHKYS